MFSLLLGLDTISPSALHDLMRREPVMVFDVNGDASWQRAHVPGARHLDPFMWTERDLPADRRTTLVFYCSNLMCRKAPNAARRARSLGYQRILVMQAGIAGWLNAGLPTESGESTAPLTIRE